MGVIEEKNMYVDVICQFTRNRSIIPLRIRMQDDDGLQQEYTVKAYKELMPYKMETVASGNGYNHSGNRLFRCRIQVLDAYRDIDIFYNSRDNFWKITKIM